MKRYVLPVATVFWYIAVFVELLPWQFMQGTEPIQELFDLGTSNSEGAILQAKDSQLHAFMPLCILIMHTHNHSGSKLHTVYTYAHSCFTSVAGLFKLVDLYCQNYWRLYIDWQDATIPCISLLESPLCH